MTTPCEKYGNLTLSSLSFKLLQEETGLFFHQDKQKKEKPQRVLIKSPWIPFRFRPKKQETTDTLRRNNA